MDVHEDAEATRIQYEKQVGELHLSIQLGQYRFHVARKFKGVSSRPVEHGENLWSLALGEDVDN